MRLEVDLDRNRIVLTWLDVAEESRRALPATLDVGAGGRLLGLDLGAPLPGVTEDGYLSLFPPLSHDVRSAEVEVAIAEADGRIARLEIPRRAPGYEITFPSGNQ
jgi:hypothetical protein